MSASSKKVRADHRKAYVAVLESDVAKTPAGRLAVAEGMFGEPEAEVLAVALVRDAGAYRLITLRMPESVMAQYTTKVTEPEYLQFQVGKVIDILTEEQER